MKEIDSAIIYILVTVTLVVVGSGHTQSSLDRNNSFAADIVNGGRRIEDSENKNSRSYTVPVLRVKGDSVRSSSTPNSKTFVVKLNTHLFVLPEEKDVPPRNVSFLYNGSVNSKEFENNPGSSNAQNDETKVLFESDENGDMSQTSVFRAATIDPKNDENLRDARKNWKEKMETEREGGDTETVSHKITNKEMGFQPDDSHDYLYSLMSQKLQDRKDDLKSENKDYGREYYSHHRMTDVTGNSHGRAFLRRKADKHIRIHFSDSEKGKLRGELEGLGMMTPSQGIPLGFHSDVDLDFFLNTDTLKDIWENHINVHNELPFEIMDAKANDLVDFFLPEEDTNSLEEINEYITEASAGTYEPKELGIPFLIENPLYDFQEYSSVSRLGSASNLYDMEEGPFSDSGPSIDFYDMIEEPFSDSGSVSDLYNMNETPLSVSRHGNPMPNGPPRFSTVPSLIPEAVLPRPPLIPTRMGLFPGSQFAPTSPPSVMTYPEVVKGILDGMPIESLSEQFPPRVVVHAPTNVPGNVMANVLSKALPNIMMTHTTPGLQNDLSVRGGHQPTQSAGVIVSHHGKRIPLVLDEYLDMEEALPGEDASGSRVVVRINTNSESGSGSFSNSLPKIGQQGVTNVPINRHKQIRIRVNPGNTNNSANVRRRLPRPDLKMHFPTSSSPTYVSLANFPPRKPAEDRFSFGNLPNSMQDIFGAVNDKITMINKRFNQLVGKFQSQVDSTTTSMTNDLKSMFNAILPSNYYEDLLTILAIAAFSAFLLARVSSMFNSLSSFVSVTFFGKASDIVAAFLEDPTLKRLEELTQDVLGSVEKWTLIDDRSNDNRGRESEEKLFDFATISKNFFRSMKEVMPQPNTTSSVDYLMEKSFFPSVSTFTSYLSYWFSPFVPWKEYFMSTKEKSKPVRKTIFGLISDEDNSKDDLIKSVDEVAGFGASLVDLVWLHGHQPSCIRRSLCEINVLGDKRGGVSAFIMPIIGTTLSWLVSPPMDPYTLLEVIRPLWLSTSEDVEEGCYRMHLQPQCSESPY